MDPPSASPAYSSNHKHSPTPLHGRDHIADADSTHARKRPRLSHELDTPPATSGHSDNLSDSQSISPESPIIIGIPQDESTDPSEISIIMPAEEQGEHRHIGSFPFIRPHVDWDTPHRAANKMMDLLWKKGTPPSLQVVENLVIWVTNHLNDTKADFEAALRDDHSSAEVFELYSDDSGFWINVVACFAGLHRHTSLSTGYDSLRSSDAYGVFENILNVLLGLGERLLYTDLAVFVQREARRDSTSSPSSTTSPKHELLFHYWADAFTMLAVRSKNFLEPMSSTYRFNTKAVQRTAISNFQGRPMDAVIKLLGHIVSKPDNIQSPFSTASHYVALCRGVFCVDPRNSDGQLETFFRKSCHLFKMIHIMATEMLPKQHLDDQSQAVVDNFRLFLIDALKTLSRTKHLLPEDIHLLTLKDIAEYQINGDELLKAPSTETLSTIGLMEAVDSLGSSLMKEGVLQAGIHACNLEFFNALIRSSSVDLRNRGVDKLGIELISIFTNEDGVGTCLDRLLRDFAIRFLLAKDIVAYLYGPQTHATLIARTHPIVQILGETSNLTKRDADTIWTVATNLQQPDNAQNAGQVLLNLVKRIPPFTLRYFCEKFRDMPLSQYTKDADILLHNLTMELLHKSPGSECHAIVTCVRLLGKLENSEITTGKQNTLLISIRNLLMAIHSPNAKSETIALIELCAGHITSLSSKATGYVSAMSCIMRQKNFAISPQDTLSRVSFKQCADELLHYFKKAKNEMYALAPQALVCRLDLVFDLLSISSPYLDTTATEKEIWDYTVGEHAFDPVFREIAWNMLVARFQTNQPGLEAFYQRCINQYLPDLSPQFVTIGTARIFALQCARQEHNETALLPLGEQLIRFALSVPTDSVANQFGSLLFTSLFKGKALRYPDLAIKNQVSVVKECISRMVQQDDNTRAPQMLLMILSRSIEFEKALRQSQKSVIASDTTVESGLPDDSIQIPIRVHKGGAQSQSKMVTINKTANCSELDAAIVSETGFESYTVVSAGHKIDFTEEPEQPIAHLGVQEGQVLVVQRRSTFQSIQDDIDNTVRRSDVEREVLAHLDVLYSMLDEANGKAHSVLQSLALLKFPGPIRAMISSTDTPFDQIFPSGRSLRLRTSIEVLNVQLREQVSLGVADEKFLIRGVHLLVALLYRPDLLQDAGDILKTADTLLALLRERPVNNVAEEYFEDATRFTHVILGIMSNLQHRIAASGMISAAIRALYQCLVEGVLLSAHVRSAFFASQTNREVHSRLLLTNDDHLRATIPSIIVNAVRDEKMASETKAFFFRLFIDHLIPAAMHEPVLCDSTFLVALEILSADQSLISDEMYLRSLIDKFSTNLLDLEHLEHYGNRFIDQRVQGLTLLLQCCIQNIISFEKPLNLSDLAPRLLRKLLFPVSNVDSVARPVIALNTRDNIYELLRLMCDDVQTVEALAAECDRVLSDADEDDEFNFLGPEKFVRQEGSYAGLENLAQTCYLNSLIQQLFMNIQFRKFIFDTPVADDRKQAVLAEFKLAFARMQNSHDVSYRPEALVKALNVDHTMQDDAHIFFMTLIGQLEDSMPDDEAKNALKKFFRGVNKSQTIGSCKHVSESTDEYFNLSLVVKDKASLEESLEEYTKGAALEGSDKFRCTTCGSGEGVSVDAVQRTALEHIPDNLVLGLRRFRYETYDGGSKVNDRFDFPERIDMSKYKLNRLAGVDGPSEPDVFQLVGVVVHQGTLQFGHYWSYAAERGATSGSLPWYRLEDSVVTSSSIEDVLRETRGGPVSPSMTPLVRDRSPVLRSDNAYVLFYQRASSVIEAAQCVASGIPMPPCTTQAKAHLPQDLEASIAKENERTIYLLHLFSSSHVNFVRDLPGRLEMIKEAEPSERKGIAGKIMTTLFEYYTRVVACSFSQDSIDYTSLVLQKLACSDQDFAGWILDQLLPETNPETNPETTTTRVTRRSLILHRKQMVRSVTNRLVLACLKFLRNNYPIYYGIEEGYSKDSRMQSYVCGLVGLSETLLDCRIAVWKEYFELLGQVAELGFNETYIMLDQDLLIWCLEILHINEDTVLHKKHSSIAYYFANSARSVDFASIVGCVYSLLHKYVDLRGGIALNNDGDARCYNPGVLLLNADEYDRLRFRSQTRNNWLVENIIQGLRRSGNSHWTDWLPNKLTVLLTNAAKAPPDIYEDATRALLTSLSCATAFDQVAESATLCLVGRTMKLQTEEEILVELERIVQHNFLRAHGDEAVSSVKFVLTEVYALQPMLILRHMAVLTGCLLVCDNAQVEEQVRNWLRLHVFVQDVLSKPYTLGDVSYLILKVRAIKSLLGILGEEMQAAIAKGQAYHAFKYSREAYHDSTTYLKQMAVKLEAELETWLNSAAPDSEHTELETALQELLDEVGSIDALVERHEACRTGIDEWKHERDYEYTSNELVDAKADAAEDSDNDQAMASDGSLSDLNEDDFEDVT
ncbi:hypothetical protein D6C76_02350 [Aureobasidium pullulans]|nr:hypothetical protein D6C76_02350 [Aureobasidium pullulans]